jgi:hypothetical protein
VIVPNEQIVLVEEAAMRGAGAITSPTPKANATTNFAFVVSMIGSVCEILAS